MGKNIHLILIHICVSYLCSMCEGHVLVDEVYEMGSSANIPGSLEEFHLVTSEYKVSAVDDCVLWCMHSKSCWHFSAHYFMSGGKRISHVKCKVESVGEGWDVFAGQADPSRRTAGFSVSKATIICFLGARKKTGCF